MIIISNYHTSLTFVFEYAFLGGGGTSGKIPAWIPQVNELVTLHNHPNFPRQELIRVTFQRPLLLPFLTALLALCYQHV
jgi:hypothetical protein